jgi:hypothetical protein
MLATMILGPSSCPAAEELDSKPKQKTITQRKLLSTIEALKDHIEGKTILDAKQIEAHKLTIDSHRELFGQNDTIINASFDLVQAYEKTQKPDWISSSGFHRRKGIPNDIKWTMINVMQNVVDRAYTAENIARYPKLLDGFQFKCADHFPGAVSPPANADVAHAVKISASFPRTFGRLENGFSRKPTGTYLAPGSIATVTVPKSLAAKGYHVRVGGHSWDFKKKPRIKRLDRISLVYSIDSTEVKVANPLGGGIYIEVPYKADGGIVEVKVRNAVRSPYFSMKGFHKTTLGEWKNIERNRKVPWADFQTEKFMMQVPTSWIDKLDDPITLLKDWDMAMDAMSDLMGLPRIRGRETIFAQVDLMMKSSAYAPGYPSSNLRFDPEWNADGYSKHHLIRGPQYAKSYEFHEQGHGFRFVKFPGEVEAAVNLPHVAVWHQKFGYSLDEAFRASRDFNKNEFRTLDTTAVTWMTSLHFVEKIPMTPQEKKYQLKGHAKFVEIVRLFGWEVLNKFWYSLNEDFENGKEWSRHGSDIDKLLLRLSKSVGVDITPLFHFWGTPPLKADALEAAIKAQKLPASAKIYDTLVKYKTLVPKDNMAFKDFVTRWWGKKPTGKGYVTEKGHAAQWDTFNEKSSGRIKETVQEIIDLYFPNGRPA